MHRVVILDAILLFPKIIMCSSYYIIKKSKGTYPHPTHHLLIIVVIMMLSTAMPSSCFGLTSNLPAIVSKTTTLKHILNNVVATSRGIHVRRMNSSMFTTTRCTSCFATLTCHNNSRRRVGQCTSLSYQPINSVSTKSMAYHHPLNHIGNSNQYNFISTQNPYNTHTQ